MNTFDVNHSLVDSKTLNVVIVGCVKAKCEDYLLNKFLPPHPRVISIPVTKSVVKFITGMFWLPDLPRLRAIEIIGWIGNWNIPKLKIMNY